MVLSKESEILLNKLVNDLNSTLSEKERVLNPLDKSSLIWNLFVSKQYEFSKTQFSEILEFLSNLNNK